MGILFYLILLLFCCKNYKLIFFVIDMNSENIEVVCRFLEEMIKYYLYYLNSFIDIFLIKWVLVLGRFGFFSFGYGWVIVGLSSSVFLFFVIFVFIIIVFIINISIFFFFWFFVCIGLVGFFFGIFKIIIDVIWWFFVIFWGGFWFFYWFIIV